MYRVGEISGIKLCCYTKLQLSSALDDRLATHTAFLIDDVKLRWCRIRSNSIRSQEPSMVGLESAGFT